MVGRWLRLYPPSPTANVAANALSIRLFMNAVMHPLATWVSVPACTAGSELSGVRRKRRVDHRRGSTFRSCASVAVALDSRRSSPQPLARHAERIRDGVGHQTRAESSNNGPGKAAKPVPPWQARGARGTRR